MRPTIKDVAAAAGVSPATVSKVLGPGEAYSVSSATAARVREAAEHLGYVPDAAASLLRSGRSDQLGVLLAATSPSGGQGGTGMGSLDAATAVRRTFDGAILAGLGEGARRLKVPALLVYPEGQDVGVQRLLDGRIGGLLVSRDPLRPSRLLERLLGIRMPVVALWTQQVPAQMGFVDVDHRGGARLAAEHLLALGHRAVAYYGAGSGPLSPGSPVVEHFALREQGYRDALSAAGLRPQRVHQPGALLDFVRSGGTAVVAETDVGASEAAQILSGAGLHIPADVSLVGFDDMVGAEFIAGGLTTVHHPATEMAALGVERLVALLGGQAGPPAELVPTWLVERRSTARV